MCACCYSEWNRELVRIGVGLGESRNWRCTRGRCLCASHQAPMRTVVQHGGIAACDVFALLERVDELGTSPSTTSRAALHHAWCCSAAADVMIATLHGLVCDVDGRVCCEPDRA